MGSSRHADMQRGREEGGRLSPTSQESDYTYVPGLVVLYNQDVISHKIVPFSLGCKSAISCEHPSY